MTTSSPATKRIVVFRLSDYLCAVRLEFVAEIVPMAQLSCPPGMPGMLHGFLNLAGSAIPVLRLDRLFGLPEQAVELFTPLMILRLKESSIALLVGRVTEVLTVADSAGLAVEPRHSFNGCVEAMIRSGDQSIHVLDAGRILLEKERQCLADFQATEQQRLRNLNLAEARA